eukprot:CAMPEP_0115873830 /NCGR_PEP_ID=MMETSP0287-20121206/24205_1 /TAXON_ID=412157 /ORGANISM="Chrysochromulina rotalis, Strain UIO044" /LENGTH=49 /DNA_ID= /DNA_START= /DNA_END= /DNA_ORIENTATION=
MLVVSQWVTFSPLMTLAGGALVTGDFERVVASRSFAATLRCVSVLPCLR